MDLSDRKQYYDSVAGDMMIDSGIMLKNMEKNGDFIWNIASD